MDLLDKYKNNNYNYIVVDNGKTYSTYFAYVPNIKKITDKELDHWLLAYAPINGTHCRIIRKIESERILIEIEHTKRIVVIGPKGLKSAGEVVD